MKKLFVIGLICLMAIGAMQVVFPLFDHDICYLRDVECEGE